MLFGSSPPGFDRSVAIALGSWGFVSARRNDLRISWPQPRNALQWMLAAVIAVEIAVITYLSFRHGLNWDGLLNWEVKARYAFQNDGVVPAALYSSETRGFTHPDYPLLIPLTELWLYLAMGEPHQFWIKIIFPLYYAAGAVLLLTSANRLTSRSWPGLVAAALLFFVPCLIGSPGGAIGGYVDVPLSVLYLATIAYLLAAANGNDPHAWRIFVCCLALLPWAKREGAILRVIAALCGAYVIVRERRWSAFFCLLPGVVLIASWKIFLGAMHASQPSEFLPTTLASLRAGLPARSQSFVWSSLKCSRKRAGVCFGQGRFSPLLTCSFAYAIVASFSSWLRSPLRSAPMQQLTSSAPGRTSPTTLNHPSRAS